MMDTSIDLTASLCRACLEIVSDDTIDMDKHDIFVVPDLATKFTACTSLSLEPYDGLPKNLCDFCYKRLLELYEFRSMCVDSLDRLQKIVAQTDAEQEEEVLYDEVEIKVQEPEDEEEDEQEHQEINDENFDSDREDDKLVEIDPRSDADDDTVEAIVFDEDDPILEDMYISETEEEKKSSIMQIESVPQKQTKRRGRPPLRKQSHSSILKQQLLKKVKEEKPAKKRKIFQVENSDDDYDDDMALKSEDQGSDDDDYDIPSAKASLSAKKQEKKKHIIMQCDICSQRFFAEHRFIAHKRAHEGLVPYQCHHENCKRGFTNMVCLRDHLLCVHGKAERVHKCKEDGCKAAYKHKAGLRAHMRRAHGRGLPITCHLAMKVCEVCGIEMTAMRLRNHRYKHLDQSEYPHGCDVPGCSRRYTTTNKLREHKLRHAGIKNFHCPYCEVRKTTKTELDIHINLHTGEKTWSCKLCSKSFLSSGGLSTHMRITHERNERFRCRFCDRCYVLKDQLAVHERTHTGEKPFVCDVCGERFASKFRLGYHGRKRHAKQSQQIRLKKVSIEKLIDDELIA